MKLYRFFAFATVLSIGTYPIPDLRIPVGSVRVPLYVPLMGGMAVIWLITLLVERGRIHYPVRLQVGLYLLILGLAMSSLMAGEIDSELVTRYLLFFLTPLLFVEVIQDRSTLEKATWILLTACVAVTLYGYYGFFTGDVGSPIDHALGYWGIHYLTASRNSDSLYPAAGFLLLIVFLADRWGECRLSVRVGLLLLTLALVLAVVICQSRSGWLTIGFGLAAVLSPRMRHLRHPKMTKRVFGVIAAAIVVLAILVPQETRALTVERLFAWSFSDPTLSNRERVLLSLICIRIAALAPLGIGPGEIAKHLQEAGRLATWAENSYLQIATELGWAAGLGLFLYVSYPIRVLKRHLSSTNGLDAWPFLGYYGLSTGLVVYLLFNVEVVSMFYWIISSLAVAAAMVAGKVTTGDSP